MNEVVEAANRNIKKIIQKIVIIYRNWLDWLPHALQAYRIAVNTLIGVMPYLLVYGMKAVMSLEMKIPSLRVLMESNLEEDDWERIRYE